MTRYGDVAYDYRDATGRWHHDFGGAIDADSLRDAIETLRARIDGELLTVWMTDADPATGATRLWECENGELTCFTEGHFEERWATFSLKGEAK